MPAIVSKPVSHPKPDVKRFSMRKIDLPPTLDDLKFKLFDWVQEVLDYIGQDERMEGVQPVTYLLANADGLDELMVASRGGMSLGPRQVFANFDWGRRENGRWYIRHIKFGTSLSRAEITAEQKRALKERLMEKAEDESASHFHARQVVFPAENYVHSWVTQIDPGEVHVNSLMGEIYEAAQAEAKIPQNWIRGRDLALAGAGDAVKLAKGAAGASKAYGETVYEIGRTEKALDAADRVEMVASGAETARKAERTAKYAEAYEKAEQYKGYADKYDAMKELGKKEDGEPVFRKSRLDVAADVGVELLSTIPGAGGFVKLFAGMFIEIGLSNYAGVVAGIRARVYACFVGGFIGSLTLMGKEPHLRSERDRKYYELGARRGVQMPQLASFQTQIYLLDYARQTITSGFWAGTTYDFHGLSTPTWDYPHDWEAKWSPELLGAAFVTKLGFKKYLIEDSGQSVAQSIQG